MKNQPIHVHSLILSCRKTCSFASLIHYCSFFTEMPAESISISFDCWTNERANERILSRQTHMWMGRVEGFSEAAYCTPPTSVGFLAIFLRGRPIPINGTHRNQNVYTANNRHSRHLFFFKWRETQLVLKKELITASLRIACLVADGVALAIIDLLVWKRTNESDWLCDCEWQTSEWRKGKARLAPAPAQSSRFKTNTLSTTHFNKNSVSGAIIRIMNCVTSKRASKLIFWKWRVDKFRFVSERVSVREIRVKKKYGRGCLSKINFY